MNSLKVYHRVTYFMYIRIILCFILVKLDENNNVYEPSNFHKMLCRGKDTMTIYSLLAIYSWVLIEGKYLRIFYTFDIDSRQFSFWCWLDDQKAYQIWIKSRTSTIYNHYENVFSLNPTLTWTLTQTHWAHFGKRLNELVERYKWITQNSTNVC